MSNHEWGPEGVTGSIRHGKPSIFGLPSHEKSLFRLVSASILTFQKGGPTLFTQTRAIRTGCPVTIQLKASRKT